jgi:putative FmdB family regulatory protein
MPTYDYQCSTCGVAFELFQSFSEDTLTKCPTKKSGNSPEGCISPGRGKVTKVFSAPGITFKGSGFYKTDSRSGSSKSGGSSGNGKESSDSSSSSDTKSDSAAKADTKKSDTKKSDSTTKAAKD